ncbi:DNA methyltransferase [Dietzia sp. 179-F 9C3 NHS]|uniref:DNA methyltransferase n=1 Tax=Dietzia sp. 179-F 9C3 NHS TaxID=3374295 RepID=UPI00387981D1
MRSGQEIQEALEGFVERWKDYTGSEKGEAQTFLTELFRAYGTDRVEVGARLEDFISTAGFLDLHWPGVCIIEMKAPHVSVETAREQVKAYWEESSTDDTPAARWVVICNFREFEVWEPGRYPKSPRIRFSLGELPQRLEALSFLQGEDQVPSFLEHHKELTTRTAAWVAEAYHSMADRRAAPSSEIQRFVMQSVWTMFAEDLGLLHGSPFQNTVELLRKDPSRNSAAELGYLFRVLNQKGKHNRKGLLAGTAYVNGELFAQPAEVELNAAELELFAKASASDWSKVDPTIFGSLMELVIGQEKRWERGAHYTHEADIMKIVGPTIVRPWQERIDAATSPQEAADLLDELCAFRVLDPACGCGNFLYIAYRELRGLESELNRRIDDLASETGLPAPAGPRPFYPVTNLLGLEIERVSVLITRVTLWMGQRQMIDRFGPAEDPLPLVGLPGIQHADALRTPWPETDCIIGNPPFMGSQRVRASLGDQYTEWLKTQFGVGVKDLCTYWFRIAQDHLKVGQRAGLVGTNSVAQNKGRAASLQYIADNGGVITDAVSSQKWPGEAKVHVSLVNWVKGEQPEQFILDGEEVEGISTSLGPVMGWEPVKLTANKGKSFQGATPGNAGFLVSAEKASEFVGEHYENRSVVKRSMTANDITEEWNQEPTRWTIDFGVLALEDALQYGGPLAVVREKVRPERESNNRASYRKYWWRFVEPRPAMRAALAPLSRFPVIAIHAKRFAMAWAEKDWLPSNAIIAFAFDDDFSMGVLQSSAHVAWAWFRSSTLETRLRYTPTSSYQTFPWPDRMTEAQREAVAAAGRAMLAERTRICTERQIGLTELYNLVDEGAFAELKTLHKKLDVAVAACYRWPASIAQDHDELVRRLLDLNRKISQGERDYDPF